MPLRFGHIWPGSDHIPLFTWLHSEAKQINQTVSPENELIHVYSIFAEFPRDVELWSSGKRIFYSGESIMDESHADVVVGFMPAGSSSPRRVLYMTPEYSMLEMWLDDRPSARYIQLRLQELDAIEWKIKQLRASDILAREPFEEVRNYLLTPSNTTPYADMMRSWAKHSTEWTPDRTDDRKFCLFMVSNPACELRNEALNLFSSVGPVVSAGAFRNNLAPEEQRPPDRMRHDEYIKYLSQFRFMITFENMSLPHYHTEKITNAFEAGVVPIYWGDPLITELYDSRSFIHIPTRDDPNEQLEAVKQAFSKVHEAQNDPEVYASYFQHPPLPLDRQQKEDARVAASLREISDELS